MADHELTPITRKDGSQSLPRFTGTAWEPFLPDHVKSIIHGTESERVIEAVARIVRSEVVEQANWLLEPIFGDALPRYCRVEALAKLLADHIFRVDDDRVPRRCQ